MMYVYCQGFLNRVGSLFSGLALLVLALSSLEACCQGVARLFSFPRGFRKCLQAGGSLSSDCWKAQFWEPGSHCCPFSPFQEDSFLGLFSSVGGILPAITLSLTGVWSRDDSSEVEAQSVWGVVVGVTASQLSSLGSGTS